MDYRKVLFVASALLPMLHLTSTQNVSDDDISCSLVDSTKITSQTFRSNPGLKPPSLCFQSAEGVSEGYIFLGLNGSPDTGRNWPTILDFSPQRLGTLIWMGNYSETYDVRMQSYYGQPVLTFWSGKVQDGYGRGSYYVLNQSYVEIAHFQVDDFGREMGDLHEFKMTDDFTALVPIYKAIPFDLTSVGGVKDGWLLDNVIQEFDLETGETVFQWRASDYVNIEESYDPLPDDVGKSEDRPWDFFHLNSIDKDGAGDYLVSTRGTDCIYKISGHDGQIMWRLHGKQSNFQADAHTMFGLQSDAHWVHDSESRMTLFDNGPTDKMNYSRGLLLDVDQEARTVTLVQEFTSSAKLFAAFEGTLQAIISSAKTTNYLLGYGSEPYFVELDSKGNVLLNVQFGKSGVTSSYRAYKQPWQGKPNSKPDIFWDVIGKSVYFSWNGATDVETWEVYTANMSDAQTWKNVTFAKRDGFETVVQLAGASLGAFVKGKALNANGDVLGWTRVSNGTNLFDASTGPNGAESLPSVTHSGPSRTRTAPSKTSHANEALSKSEDVSAVFVSGIGLLILVWFAFL